MTATLGVLATQGFARTIVRAIGDVAAAVEPWVGLAAEAIRRVLPTAALRRRAPTTWPS